MRYESEIMKVVTAQHKECLKRICNAFAAWSLRCGAEIRNRRNDIHEQ